MKKYLSVIPLVFLLCFVVSCQDKAAIAEREGQIIQGVNAKMDGLINAVKDLEINQILSIYSNNVTVIDQATIIPSPDEFRADYKAAIEMFTKVEHCQLVNRHIHVLSEDAAVFFSEIEQKLVLASGEMVDASGAMTAVFKYSEGDWKIIHLHSSHPTS